MNDRVEELGVRTVCGLEKLGRYALGDRTQQAALGVRC
jgi:hypothetical protein